MLGKMIIQGLVAAMLIGGAAAVYAQTKDRNEPPPAASGYLPQPADGARGSHADRAERRHGDRDRDSGRERHRRGHRDTDRDD
jgi:hypothetical protein